MRDGGRRGPLNVSVVVPMFNEEEGVGHLLDRLDAVRERLRDFTLRTILVDDGSTDGTWELIESANRADTTLHRHEENRGIAAAIMTGIRAAETEIVCSIDADCSYDPQDIEKIVPLLEGAAMVTASPYHPGGRVAGVSWGRLFLSRNLSRLYSLVLKHKLYTYTSCFRAYRRSKVVDIQLDHGDFLGIAELAIRLIRSGERVVEFPAVLGTRTLGRSKMKTLRTVKGHLGFLAAVVGKRI